MGLLKAIYLSELPLNFVAPSIAPVQPEKEKMQKLEDVLRKKSKELSTRTNSGKSSFRNKLLVSKLLFRPIAKLENITLPFN